ncbi:MAG: hypothetical protein AB7E81_17955 [Hyphomicrobiaceae bacterium]|jgi:hypothetical protein
MPNGYRQKLAVRRMKAAERDRLEEAQRKRDDFADYLRMRSGDIDTALARRVAKGDLGMPYLLIDTVFAVAVTGNERGQAPNLRGVLENAKDRLWFECRHLGGDAVIHADFRIEHGKVAFTNKVGVAWNMMAHIVNSASRTKMSGMSPADMQATITVFAQGSAVRLLPQNTKLAPQLYEQFDKRWLDLSLPPGISDPAQAQAHVVSANGQSSAGEHAGPR